MSNPKRSLTDEDGADAVKRHRSDSNDEVTSLRERNANLEKRVKELEAKVQELESKKDSEQKSTPSESSKEENKVETATSNIKKDELLTPQETDASKTNPTLKPKATFGASLFKIGPVVVTPQNLFETPTVPNTVKKPETPVFGLQSSFNKSTPSFGSTTKFGSPVDLSNKPNVFDAEKKKSSFGSNSKFANALENQLRKKSFLDEPTEVTKQEPKQPQFKQVDLEKTEITTGEEDEVSKFNATCKLFELDLTKVLEGWKERGLGPVHVNHLKKEPILGRIVMRSQGLLRVVLNYKIQPDTKLMLGLEASLTPGKYLRLNLVGSSGNPSQYLLKFGNETIRTDFVNAVEAVKADLS